MNHHTTADFWDCYGKLPTAVQRLADANYELLRENPWHPSLHFKRVGRLWSVRVGKATGHWRWLATMGRCGFGSGRMLSITVSSQLRRDRRTIP
jgi:hypothetical protein